MDTTAPDLLSWIRRQTSAQPYQPSKIICLVKEPICISCMFSFSKWAASAAACHFDILYSYKLEWPLHPLIICFPSSWCLYPNLTDVMPLVRTHISLSSFKWAELEPKVAPLLFFLFAKFSLQIRPSPQQFIDFHRSSLNWFSYWLRNYFEVIIRVCT